MFVYLCIVHAWTIFLYPLGRDYRCLAQPESMPAWVRQVFELEMQGFGTGLPGYHLVNLMLLYAGMVALFFFTRYAVRGPWWLGSLAAVLWMANPAKSEAVLNLSGVRDLLPVFFALAAMTAYAAHVLRPRWWKLSAALLLFAVATLSFQVNLMLLLAVLLFEGLVAEPHERRWSRTLLFVLLGVAGLYLHRGLLSWSSLNPAEMFGPLLLIFYPIGLLPETAGRLHTYPILGWLSAAAFIMLLVLIDRKARHSALRFGLLAALAVRLFQADHTIDPVHTVGGGQLLLAMAFVSVAFSALCRRMVQHPKWHLPVIFLTTVLCVVFFVLQGRVNWAWRHAGQQVQAFQAQAAETAQAHPGETLGVLPDYQYYRGAPMMLSDSVAFDTLFSKALPVVFLLPLHYDVPSAWGGTLDYAMADSRVPLLEVYFKGVPTDYICAPYALDGNRIPGTEHPVADVRMTDDLPCIRGPGFVAAIRSEEATLPRVWVSFLQRACETEPEGTVQP